MFRARLSAAVVVLGALTVLALTVTVPRASAVEPFPIGGQTMLTAHFAIHYDNNPAGPDYITQQRVTDIAGWAERAYALYLSWGYPAPPPSNALSPGRDTITIIQPLYDDNAIPTDPLAGTTSGALEVSNGANVGMHEVAHAVFSLFQFGMWQPTNLWLEQAAAEWAAFRAENFTTAVQADLGQSDNTGDCVGGDCGTVSYDEAGDPGWTFMEYLSERFGPDTIKALFTDGAALGQPSPAATQYVSDVLASHGTTFNQVFNDFTVARLTGNFSIDSIKGLLPVPQVSVSAGSVTGPIPTTHVAVSHFAARYIALQHRDVIANDAGTCYAATLALSVAIPPAIAGVNPAPYYYANTAGATAQALTVSGGNATITVPWNTCAASPDAYLSLPNPSTDVTANGEDYVISGTLTVDKSTPTAATPPPDPIFTGPTVAAPTTDVVPSILVYGAQIVRVSTADRLVRLIVFSSGDGQLQASAGTVNLGTYQLRAGNNDVRFKLPQSIVNQLRKPAGPERERIGADAQVPLPGRSSRNDRLAQARPRQAHAHRRRRRRTRSSMTVRAALIASVVAALLSLASPALAATHATVAAPTGLHAFLLRVDEPPTQVFSRTPSFAWNPVPGAVHYEFQLSTSGSFQDSGTIFDDATLTSPVVAPALTLPWITGTPHALYARVRAVLDTTSTDWSNSFGFDMQPPAPPTPLPSYPGLLRWTPVDGAVGYEVWFVDIPKVIEVTTNVADEREFYTFHQAVSWLATVRWRIRAVRDDFNKRLNGLPVVTHGAWSPVYSSVNPPFAVGPLKPVATVSDVASTGSASSPAQRLMPAFVYSGNQSFLGIGDELYRVYVYTDRGCLNRVFTGAIVGSPAYAPRFSGPLALPQDSVALANDRGQYLVDGQDTNSYTWDGELVTANEAQPPVTATVGLPGGTTSSAPATPTTPGTPGAPAAPAAPAAPTAPVTPGTQPSTIQLLNLTGAMGPPIDLWDTDWANGGGYYWTVVGVDAKVPGALSTTISGPVNKTSIPVTNATGFSVGDQVSIGSGGSADQGVIASIAGNVITLGSAPANFHFPGEAVTRTAGTLRYTDDELAQDVCAAGRIMRFGKESEPALTASGELFATGLSPTGKLASANDTRSFYGAPLVAWTTALGAEVYEVQWSKTKVPFSPETDPATGAIGMMTLNTSEVLPLTTGTWYFRVRGFDYSLPSGAQAMTWSDPQQIVVSKPTFTIVGGSAIGTTSYRVPAGGFSVSVPSTWAGVDRRGAGTALKTKPALVAYLGPKLKSLASGSSSLRFVAYDPSGSTVSTALVVQATAAQNAYTTSAWLASVARQARTLGSSVSCARVSLPAGPSLRCTYTGKAQGRTESAVVYFLQHRGGTYSLTFTSTPGAAHAKAPVFAGAARSFRFTS